MKKILISRIRPRGSTLLLLSNQLHPISNEVSRIYTKKVLVVIVFFFSFFYYYMYLSLKNKITVVALNNCSLILSAILLFQMFFSLFKACEASTLRTLMSLSFEHTQLPRYLKSCSPVPFITACFTFLPPTVSMSSILVFRNIALVFLALVSNPTLPHPTSTLWSSCLDCLIS